MIVPMPVQDLIMDLGTMRSPVVLSRCPDYETVNVKKALQVALDHLGGINRFISSGDRVLIKPNLIKGVPPEAHATTHPAVIEAVVCHVLDCGGHPFIGDSPAFGDLSTVAAKTGIANICKRYGIPLIPFASPVHVNIPDPMVQRIAIDQTVLEADKIINIPKLKTHTQVGMTGAVKNLFGCVVGKRKVVLHFKLGDSDHHFGRMLLGVYKVLNPTLHIVDGIVAMEGDGPANGRPKHLGLLSASSDGLALDRVLCEIIGLPVSSVEIFAALNRHYNKEIDINGITVLGTPISSFIDHNFALPNRAPIRFNLLRIALSILRHQKLRLIARFR